MPIALRDAPRGGQDGARLDEREDKDGPQRNAGAADLHDDRKENLHAGDYPKTCGEVTP